MSTWWTPVTGPGRATSPEDEAIIGRLKDLGARAILALNKIDLVDRANLLAATKALFDTGVYSDVLMISGLNGDGVEQLADLLAARMPVGPYLFPEDQAADIPSRLIAAEVTREKLMLRLHQGNSLPAHGRDRELGAARQWFGEDRPADPRRPRRPPLDHSGQGWADHQGYRHASRKELSEIFGRPIHLFLRVKVSERWQDNRERFTAIGLDFDA